VETFTKPNELVDNPNYHEQRQQNLAGLTEGMIDAPLRGLIAGFNQLSCCFTLQCCYGHFLYNGQKDPDNLDPLPVTRVVDTVEYRIAYIALCIDNSAPGRRLIEALAKIPSGDPENIQFCCAEWFWERQVNSYALQVEPDRFKHEDKAMLPYGEALKIEEIRNDFFLRLQGVLHGAG